MQLKKWSVLGAAALMSISMTGCFGDDDTSTNETEVTVPSELAAGESVAVTVSISSDKDIETVSVTVDYIENGYTGDTKVSVTSVPTPDGDKVDLEGLMLTAAEGACNGKYALVISYGSEGDMLDKTNNFTVTGGEDCKEVVATPIAMDDAKTGTIYNVEGPKQGAFDLKTGEGVSASKDDAIKDLKDMSVAKTDADLFSKEFTSGNGAKFAVLTAATEEALAEAEYSEKTGELEDGAIVAVKLSADRDGDIYLIEVVKVTDDAEGDNAGSIEFKYIKYEAPAAE